MCVKYRPDGWLYDKESILEYILHKKLENARLLKEYQKQLELSEKDSKELGDAEYKDKVQKFLKSEGKVVSASKSSTSSTPSTSSSVSSTPGSSKSKEEESSVSNMKGEAGKKLPSFWVPSLVPESKIKAKPKKPDTTIYCPMSNKPISMKDLIGVKFKLLEDKEDKRALIAKQERYVCPVTNDVLGNSVPCCVLRTS